MLAGRTPRARPATRGLNIEPAHRVLRARKGRRQRPQRPHRDIAAPASSQYPLFPPETGPTGRIRGELSLIYLFMLESEKVTVNPQSILHQIGCIFPARFTVEVLSVIRAGCLALCPVTLAPEEAGGNRSDNSHKHRASTGHAAYPNSLSRHHRSCPASSTALAIGERRNWMIRRSPVLISAWTAKPGPIRRALPPILMVR